MIFISSNFSNFTDEIQNYYNNLEVDVLPPLSNEKQKLIKKINIKNNIIVNIIKKSNNNHIYVILVKRLFSTTLISKKQKSKRYIKIKNNI